MAVQLIFHCSDFNGQQGALLWMQKDFKAIQTTGNSLRLLRALMMILLSVILSKT